MLNYPSVAGVSAPPQSLLWMDKDAAAGIAHGRRIVDSISRCTEINESLLLDIGCGWGRVAYGLLDYGFTGRYVGFDLLPKQIGWLRENFTPHQPKFRFELADLPIDGLKAVDIATLVAEPVGVAIAMSVFTHVFDNTVSDYLQQIYQALAPGKAFVFTSFLMNEESRRLSNEGRGYFPLKHQLNDHTFFDRPDNPRQVISYSEKWLLDQVISCGFDVERVIHGHWCGRDKMLYSEGQDWIVARKPA